MKYFTRGWANGELSEAESERIREAYWTAVREMMPRFPQSMVRLAETNLHDAEIERICWDAGKKLLHMRLVTGDLQAGYSTVDLRYRGAMLGDIRIETLKDAARDREVVVLYDELDMDAKGILSHRLLFWPSAEISLDFRELELEVTPRADRRVSLGGHFVEETPD